ncbi:PqqD family protein [Pararhodobacter oceanensis]|uniref:PqqD family protein n=1 Tax=Pararhodobacter oceanensis TaxID=2172121 RepID=UPI003A9007EC
MSRYSLNTPTVISETVDGEVIIINLDDGNYHSLRGNAADLWQNLSSGVGVDAIVAVATGASARAVVDRFVAELSAKGLINPIAEAPIATDPTPWSTEGVVIESYDDMSDLLGLDPVHEVDMQAGWPKRPEEA